MRKQQLPNLNGLRFIAAATVLFFHVNLALVSNNYKAVPYTFFPFGFGDLAVVLFFVLSGFLITYLLLNEKEKGEINVKKFYLKRVFRIWPLYYLIVILAFVFFNTSGHFYWAGVTTRITTYLHPALYTILFAIICPNVALLGSESLGYANPTWSLGVEEQFYIIWPHIIKVKKPLRLIAMIIIVVFLFNQGLLHYFLSQAVRAHLITNQLFISIVTYISKFFTFNYSFKIDSMAIGSLGAFVSMYRKVWLKYIFSIPFQIVLYAITAILLFYPHLVVDQLYCVAFIIIILNLAFNPITILRLQNRVLNYLGKISYGIYIYHALTIIPAIRLVTKLSGFKINIFTELIIDFISLGITIGIASISYRYFERYFLKLKSKLDEDIADY